VFRISATQSLLEFEWKLYALKTRVLLSTSGCIRLSSASSSGKNEWNEENFFLKVTWWIIKSRLIMLEKAESLLI